MAGIIKKQFSTFTVSYADVEIDSDNFRYSIDVEGHNGDWGHIWLHELSFTLAQKLRSDDEGQVRDALDLIIDNRRFWANQLESLLK